MGIANEWNPPPSLQKKVYTMVDTVVYTAEERMLKIGEFSRVARVTVKTLHLYDRLGLLRPAQVEDMTGYRLHPPPTSPPQPHPRAQRFGILP